MPKIRRSQARDGDCERIDGDAGDEREAERPIQAAEDADSEKRGKQKQQNGQQQQAQMQKQKKTKKQPAIVSFFKRMKLLRPPWRRRRRSRSRGRSRGRAKGAGDEEADDDADSTDALTGSPGALDLRPLPPRRSLAGATAVASLTLDPWGCPYDFAVQGDRLLVPGLDVAEFSLATGRGVGDRGCRWPATLGRYVPLCIDATPGLVYLTAASATRCGLFVFDRSDRLAASRLAPEPDDAEIAASRRRRPGMFAVRVNFRGECWVTNPRDLTVDHYTAALMRIRSIDVARFGVPYYLTAHSHRHACLWVSFPEARRVVKFDWLTLEPLCHLAFDAGQSPCGLHLDELGEQLLVTDIGTGRMLVYRAATMGLATGSTRAANAAVAGRSQRPAAVRLAGGRLLLLSCPAADRCRVDVYEVAFREGESDSD